jgi:hypothetical protein
MSSKPNGPIRTASCIGEDVKVRPNLLSSSQLSVLRGAIRVHIRCHELVNYFYLMSAISLKFVYKLTPNCAHVVSAQMPTKIFSRLICTILAEYQTVGGGRERNVKLSSWVINPEDFGSPVQRNQVSPVPIIAIFVAVGFCCRSIILTALRI